MAHYLYTGSGIPAAASVNAGRVGESEACLKPLEDYILEMSSETYVINYVK